LDGKIIHTKTPPEIWEEFRQCMQIPEKKLREFQKLYKKHYGEEISLEESYERGIRLIRFVQIIYGIKGTASKNSQQKKNFTNSLYYESFQN
jgi:hypothetical protein